MERIWTKVGYRLQIGKQSILANHTSFAQQTNTSCHLHRGYYPANNGMQGPQGPCTGNCAGPVRAARTGPVSIWPRAPKWPHMGLTARVSWRRNADFLHGFYCGLLQISCTVFIMVLCGLPTRFLWWPNANFPYGIRGGLAPTSCKVFMLV